MKLAYMNPTESGRWFEAGRTRRVGKWTYTDEQDALVMTRTIAHHGHVMGIFVLRADSVIERRKALIAGGLLDPRWSFTEWCFTPISVGWGSVSDQGGMNKVMPSAWRYRRNGGNPRYEFNGVEHKF